ncbi:unnamed protein product [Sphagnum jensenii]|uniref:Transposase n=1 Tax=Sphagnum jensenii TaxID=128206 RepID=A0ABP1B3R1_9BRYO
MQTTFTKDGSYLAVHNVLDSDTTADIMTKVVEWVINTKQSFSSVEAPSFKAMTKALNRFRLGCSRATLIRAINDEMIAATVQFRQVVESIPRRVAITCDGCEVFIKPKLEKFRTVIKTICLSPKLRAGFKNVQVRLGKKESETKEVLGLDVENR